ncbi:MAG: TonB-dependent receptor, partial [Gammaproteobacteria bacterium]
LFYDDIKDLINYEFDSTLNQYVFDNHDNASIHGFEASLTLRPTPRSRMIANYAHTRIKSTHNTVNSEYDIAFPKHLFSLVYIQQFSDRYQGSLGFYHRTATKGLARRSFDPRQLDPYKRMDLRLVRKLKLLKMDSELALVIQNSFDEVHFSRQLNYPRRQAYLSWQAHFE